jgi:hypothetical protein
VKNFARKSSLKAGARWRKERGGAEERINSVWNLVTGNRKCRWRARVYPERGNEVVAPQPNRFAGHVLVVLS